jgi:glycosyltransferase involved in cell wall biosynthesis
MANACTLRRREVRFFVLQAIRPANAPAYAGAPTALGRALLSGWTKKSNCSRVTHALRSIRRRQGFSMRVAIVHYWLVGMRGGEKVLEALCDLFPQADIFTHVYNPEAISAKIRRHRVQTSFISRLPRASRNYKSYLPLMPLALEQLDLRGYDLIISSESGPSKGIIPPAGALHLCYCHSPMRYIWNMFHDYRERSGPLTRVIMPPVSHYLRTWDAVSAMRVHGFIANSQTVARRLWAYYRRESTVIHPPVRVEEFTPVSVNAVEDFYLMAGELVPYKRPDLAVDAFNKSGQRLIVVGGGEMLSKLQAMAKPNVSVLGPRPFDELKSLYARCRALIFPGEEDFGMVPVEAMASGRPVVAFGKGGATETVLDGRTGCFFGEQTIDALLDAVRRCDAIRFDQSELVKHASTFSADRFATSMRSYIDQSLAGHMV